MADSEPAASLPDAGSPGAQPGAPLPDPQPDESRLLTRTGEFSAYPPIADYGFLSDCEVTALVAPSANRIPNSVMRRITV